MILVWGYLVSDYAVDLTLYFETDASGNKKPLTHLTLPEDSEDNQAQFKGTD